MAGTGRPKGRKDNPINKRKARSESEQQKEARIQKAAATRRLNNAKKKDSKAQETAHRQHLEVQNFFQHRAIAKKKSHTCTNSVTPQVDQLDAVATNQVESSEENSDVDNVIANVETDGEGDSVRDHDGHFVINNEEVEVAPALDVTANLDIDEDEIEGVLCYEYWTSDNETLGVQQEYVKHIQLRLREEVKENNKSTNLWLLEHLKANDWWIRKVHAPMISKKLGLPKSYNAYHRDVYVWLPDVRWVDINCMPCCPTCNSNENVGNNGFHSNHFGRLIVGLKENYYAISRSYCCYSCMRRSKDVEAAVDQAFDEDEHISVEKMVDTIQYTFMGWDNHSLPLFPLGRGSEFPAFLTHRAGVDKVIIDLMRPLFDKGLKPESLSNTLLELHTAEFAMKSLRHEYEIKRNKKNKLNLASSEHLEPLGDFADKLKNRGLVPTGCYLMHVYKAYHATIRQHLLREVKKRDADMLILDVSYKEAKALYRYRGKPVFRGLVTGLNSIGEVRIQFHIYSDSHEQMLSALQAFEKTRKAMGFPGVTHIVGDNPRKEASLYLASMESVREQQNMYDSHVVPSGKDPVSATPLYNPSQLLIKLAHGQAEIGRVINAMREEMKGHAVGLDAEWNMVLDSRGIQTGRGRIQLIQIAYRNQDDAIRVLLLSVGDLKSLPDNLQNLLLDENIQIVGNKVSGDLIYIGLDFGIEAIKSVDQKKRKNVVNLGMYARLRNVVPTGNVSLPLLCELTLGSTIDKSLQTSTWTKNLTEAQKMYAAVDAAVSLEVYEKLVQLKDLSCRLTEAEAIAGTRVDIIPSNGNPLSMASRAATGTILGSKDYVCPVGYTMKGNRVVRVGKRMCVIKIDQINAPGLVLPRYKYKNSKSPVTLADIGKVNIIVPLEMLTSHTECDHGSGDQSVKDATTNITAPAESPTTQTSPRRSERGHIPKVYCPVDGYESAEEVGQEEESGVEAWEAIEDEIDETMKDLTSEDIELLEAAIYESKETEQGQRPLRCEDLDDPPSPELIINRYRATLGDVFHGMDRAKVPVKHEAKKAYFVALREAFLVWNPTKLKELEDNMRNSGLTDEEIKAQKYYNARLYRGCVDRKVPPPNILYWRVRAVYTMYGMMIDSQTKKPLFGPRAWKKANNVLKDILDGYYSDPPDLVYYTKKLGTNGDVVMNQFGMEVLECCRGTNRTESFHKNLTVTFGRWNVGVEMSDCLLAERRHRHNQKCSERRRLGFPVLGHFNTWVVDQLQNLVRENHGIQLYPYWTNASDYIDTDESFDTIALHNADLHSKLEQKSKELGAIKLTREQQYICKAMGTTLPFLPFVHKDEKKAYAKYVLEREQSQDFDKAAEDWVDHVDGVNIMPKLPSHMRTYDEAFSRNTRIKECVKNAAGAAERLKELHDKITPCAASDTNVSGWKAPVAPSPMPEPPVQAMNNAPFLVIGHLLVGNNPADDSGPRKQARHCGVCGAVGCSGLGGYIHCPQNKKPNIDGMLVETAKKRKKRQCKVCQKHGPEGLNCGIGSGNQMRCKYYNIDGDPKESK